MQLSEVSGIYPTRRTFALSDELLDPHCVIGVEVEAEGIRFANLGGVRTDLWDIKEDGSIRNGREFATKPLFGKDLVDALENLDGVLSSLPNTTISYRCGLHVHLDVSGFTVEQLMSLSCATALAEEFLFRYVGEERRSNIYCLPFASTTGLARYYSQIKHGKASREINSNINSTYKYSAFNILPVLTQGSVEYRHHGGTWKKDEILKWINILLQLRNTALEYTAEELVNMPFYSTMAVVLGKFQEELCPSGEIDLDGWLTAKDLLNYSNLDSKWNKVSSVYLNNSYLSPKGF